MQAVKPLTKTRSILTFIQETPSPWGAHRVGFGVADIDFDPAVTFLDFSEEAWIDMGRPMEITVTVEPGDTLNEDDQ